MKKIVRVIIKTVIFLIIYLVILFLFIQLFTIDTPDIAKMLLFFLILIIILFFGIFLLANPTKKTGFTRVRRVKIKNIEKTKEFLGISNGLMQSYGGILEKKRKQTLLYIKILCLVVIGEIIGTILLAYIIPVIMLIPIKVLIVIYFIPVATLIFKIAKSRKQFIEEYKKNIIKELVKNVDKNLHYEYDGNEQIYQKYEECNFEEVASANTFECTDYIYGQLKEGIQLELAKISLVDCDRTGKITATVDTCIYSHTRMHCASPCEVRIKKNEMIKLDQSRVEIDSEEFEKYFDITSNSNMIVMQILTHDVMEEIVQFYKKYQIDFEILIKENTINIKFKTGNVFTPKLFKMVEDNELLWTYYQVINFIISLSSRLNQVIERTEL